LSHDDRFRTLSFILFITLCFWLLANRTRSSNDPAKGLMRMRSAS
jgi:hypothetical protein